MVSETKKWCSCLTGVLSVDSMKALDLVTMKKLDSKVNIIPVIAKADTITKTELQKFKSKVSLQLKNPKKLVNFTDHFTGPGKAVGCVCVCVCPENNI